MQKLWILIAVQITSCSLYASDLCSDLFIAEAIGTQVWIAPEFVKKGAIEIPVFSDVHGNLDGLFYAIGELQTLRQRIFPIVFVTGDLGFYPDPSRLSEEMKAKELSKPHEKGLCRYYHNPSLFNKYFRTNRVERRLHTQIFFLRGKHEDQGLLTGFNQTFKRQAVTVDPYGVLHYLTDGSTVSLHLRGASRPFEVSSFGGIYPDRRRKGYRVDPRIGFDQERINELLEHHSEERTRPDLLLTYQGVWPSSAGDEEINDLVERLNPRVHFSGHGHTNDGPYHINTSISYPIGALKPSLEPDPTDGSAMIVELHQDGSVFVIENLSAPVRVWTR